MGRTCFRENFRKLRAFQKANLFILHFRELENNLFLTIIIKTKPNLCQDTHELHIQII